VRIRFIEPGGTAVTADEVLANLSRRTRLFCTTWAHSFTGALVDVASIGEACHANGVRFVLNASQAVGAQPLRPLDLSVDAVTSVGFKWLCGPYGTGFAWVRPDLLASLDVNRLYWLAFMSAEDLVGDRPPDLSRDIGACRYDIFGTANFFNFTAWRVAIELVLAVGLETIALRNEALVQRFLAGLPGDRFEAQASPDADRRSSLICFSHKDASRNPLVFDRLRSAGIDVAARRGLLRVSPHFYNTEDEIDRALGVIDAMA
jgi:selenocysteine lyase/cysteine desulfurase